MPKGLIRVPDSMFFDEKRENAFERRLFKVRKEAEREQDEDEVD